MHLHYILFPYFFTVESSFRNDEVLELIYTIMFSLIHEIITFKIKKAAVSFCGHPSRDERILTNDVTWHHISESAGFLLEDSLN